jgi:hypothetical protein
MLNPYRKSSLPQSLHNRRHHQHLARQQCPSLLRRRRRVLPRLKTPHQPAGRRRPRLIVLKKMNHRLLHRLSLTVIRMPRKKMRSRCTICHRTCKICSTRLRPRRTTSVPLCQSLRTSTCSQHLWLPRRTRHIPKRRVTTARRIPTRSRHLITRKSHCPYSMTPACILASRQTLFSMHSTTVKIRISSIWQQRH